MSQDGYEDWTKFIFVANNEPVPEISCVYFLMNDDELVYIGQTKNMRNRIRDHNIRLKYNIKIGDKEVGDDFFNCLYCLPIENNRERRLEIEKYYIDRYEPKLNYFYDMGLKMYDPDINEWLYDIKIKIPADAEQVMDDGWFKK